ncbi:hypothetical protein LTR65_008973 [Meristemomyces frigidus]
MHGIYTNIRDNIFKNPVAKALPPPTQAAKSIKLLDLFHPDVYERLMTELASLPRAGEEAKKVNKLIMDGFAGFKHVADGNYRDQVIKTRDANFAANPDIRPSEDPVFNKGRVKPIMTIGIRRFEAMYKKLQNFFREIYVSSAAGAGINKGDDVHVRYCAKDHISGNLYVSNHGSGVTKMDKSSWKLFAHVFDEGSEMKGFEFTPGMNEPLFSRNREACIGGLLCLGEIKIYYNQWIELKEGSLTEKSLVRHHDMTLNQEFVRENMVKAPDRSQMSSTTIALLRSLGPPGPQQKFVVNGDMVTSVDCKAENLAEEATEQDAESRVGGQTVSGAQTHQDPTINFGQGLADSRPFNFAMQSAIPESLHKDAPSSSPAYTNVNQQQDSFGPDLDIQKQDVDSLGTDDGHEYDGRMRPPFGDRSPSPARGPRHRSRSTPPASGQPPLRRRRMDNAEPGPSRRLDTERINLQGEDNSGSRGYGSIRDDHNDGRDTRQATEMGQSRKKTRSKH